MDELYSNLENYNEVNIVEELKNENKELKYKLDEYSNAMNQLQTDFDKLNNEYKKLEVNYSSLLKTARAEIERKTQMITNLNREKDILVIKSMQNGQKNILNNLTHNMNRGSYNKNETNKKEDNKVFPIVNKSNLAVKAERRFEPRLQSPIDSVSSIATTNKSTSSENTTRNLIDKKSSQCKENILKNEKETKQQNEERQPEKAKSRKIMDRRKSMPVLSNWDVQLSSDEEHPNDLKRQHNYENKNNDMGYGRTHKAPEPSCGSKNKYTSERYTEKYNPHADNNSRSRQRANHRQTPERDRYNFQRGNDRFHRSDYRQRRLRSPPSDKYNRGKSRDAYNRHREKDFDRDYDNYNVKHNTRHDYDSEERAYIKEPDQKRRRIDSTSTDTERHDRFMDRGGLKHSEYSLGVNHDIFTSCQSPDYDQIESNLSQHYVREIKYTSTVQLEDPRTSSKKYLLNKSDKGRFITAKGTNVHMVPIDRTQWGLEKVEVPEALKEKTWNIASSDDVLKYIYMDIDEPSRTTSTKNNNQVQNTDSESHMPVTTDVLTNKLDYQENIYLTKSYKESGVGVKSHDEVPQILHSNYKIPKKSKSDTQENTSHKDQSNKNETSTNKSARNCKKTSADSKLASTLDTLDIESSSNVEFKDREQRLTPNKDIVATDLELSELSEASDMADEIQNIYKYDKKFKIENNTHNKEEVISQTKDVLKIRIVNDNKHIEKNKHIKSEDNKREECNEVLNDTSKLKRSESTEEIQKIICNANNFEKKSEQTIEDENKTIKEKVPKQIDRSKKKVSKKKCEERSDECDFSKGSKDTRKREKKKKATKDEKERHLLENVISSENIEQKAEEVKGSKPKNKFTELFGESSSLITPDDLGIGTKYNINTDRNDNYGSLFENTQDAIDLNVTEIQKIHNTENPERNITNEHSKTLTEDNPHIPNVIDNQSVFKVEDKQSSYKIFKNIKPASTDSESNVIKTVVISSGVQGPVPENDPVKKGLPELKSNNELGLFASKQTPVEFLKAVATSTPNKMQWEISSRLSEVSSPNSVTLTNKEEASSSNICHSPAVDGTESNAPDVRIFLKRRRKIKKT